MGIVWPWIIKFNLGQLPGDIIIKKENIRFYFPVVTSIVISLVVSILFWVFKR
jgi:hypothetical protein